MNRHYSTTIEQPQFLTDGPVYDDTELYEDTASGVYEIPEADDANQVYEVLEEGTSKHNTISNQYQPNGHETRYATTAQQLQANTQKSTTETVPTPQVLDNKSLEWFSVEKPTAPRKSIIDKDGCCYGTCSKIFKPRCLIISLIIFLTCSNAALAAYFTIYYLKSTSMETETTATTIKPDYTTTAPTTTTYLSTTSAAPPRSCAEINENKSGFYFIYDEHGVGEEVYCDMRHGSKWTLVASINENDYDSTCDLNDRWTDFRAKDLASWGWGSKSNYGNARNSLKDDYKSLSYHKLTANEVGIVHVKESINTFEDLGSSLKYSTKNFQSITGNKNLQNYYESQRFSLVYEEAPEVALKTISEKLLNATSEIISKFGGYWIDIPVFGSSCYTINFHPCAISNNGYRFARCMTDYGNLAYYWKYYQFDTPQRRNYLFAVGESQFVSDKPITIEVGQSKNFTKVISGEISDGDFKLLYNVAVIPESFFSSGTDYNAFYVVTNEQDWSSAKIKLSDLDIEFRNSIFYETVFTVQHAQNVVMGYMLLTSSNRSNEESTIRDVMEVILNQYLNEASFSVFFRISVLEVQVIVNNENSIAEYLQLGAYNFDGFPTAFCPGKRPEYPDPESFCIGGISTARNKTDCNDFRNWKDSNNDEETTTTILIFYVTD